ncbi:T7SS effector LXG polymorphic toxin [Alkalicoccobacillus porphyridii]|uniref:LXG domain-containing protein n=1 Tax=Alkalicoccobacillus porphyridii TaxID=2597270 RepID=A0A553ZUW5_9BACI|nr:T7SS effector LXG polymorphic toxin [Alkalicoccobacillus porphyridii]TSB45222.1 hypothetical protein FN960_17305 [Alkalicoccobacillus porphyridii]
MSEKSIDASHTISLLESIGETVNDQSTQLNSYRRFLSSQETSLRMPSSGKTASSINRFLVDVHLPIVEHLQTALKDFSSHCETMRNQISNELSEDAIIDQEFLTSTLHNKLDQLKDTTENHGEGLFDLSNEYSDVVRLPNFNYASIIEGLSSSQKDADDTVTALHNLDSEMKSPLESVRDSFDLIKTLTSRVETMISSGDMSISNFSRSTIKSEESYQELNKQANRKNISEGLGAVSGFLGYSGALLVGSQNIAAGFSKGINKATKTNYTQYSRTLTRKFNSMEFSNKYIDKAKYAFHQGINATKRGIVEIAIGASKNETIRSTAQKLSNFEVNKGRFGDSATYKVLDSKFTRALGPIGWGATAATNIYDEFYGEGHEDKSGVTKLFRAGAGTLVEGGSATAGAVIGGALGSIAGPAGTLIGAGVGSVAGAYVGEKIAPAIKDGVEYITSGQLKEDFNETVTNIGNKYNDIKSSVVGWFK